MIRRNSISLRAFIVYMENSLRFEISLRSIWRHGIFAAGGAFVPKKEKKKKKNFIWFGQKEPIKVQNFKLSTADVKFH